MSPRIRSMVMVGWVAIGFVAEAFGAEQPMNPGARRSASTPLPYSDIADSARISDSTIILTNTGVGPSGATGVAEIENADKRGPGPSAISLKIQRLSAGLYELNAIRKSDGVARLLGVLAVGDPSLEPEREAGDSRKEDNTSHQSEVLSTQTRLELPADFDPLDLAQLMLSPMGGNAILVWNAPSRATVENR